VSAVHQLNATDYDDALLRLVDLASNDNVKAAAIAGGGAGYVVGDVLTVVGGTIVSTLVATLEVTAEAAGVITGIRVFNCGAYSAQPGNPVSVTGGTGAGATFTLTFETNNWVVNRNVASSTAAINYPVIQGGGGTQILEREIQLKGVGNAGTDEIYAGFLEVRDNAQGSFNWAIAGMTGFDSGQTWEDQPGFSYISPNEIAAFVPLANAAIECWFYVSPRVLTGVMRIGSTYNNFTIGFLNPFATPAEFPYPLYISGCSSKWNEIFSTSGVSQSGLVDPGANTASGGNPRGPAGVRFVDGQWWPITNWTFNGSTRSASAAAGVYPCQQILPNSAYIAPADKFIGTLPNQQWVAFCPDVGNPGTQAMNLFPSENPGGDETILVPTMVYFTSPSLQILGELADMLWGTTTGANIVAQDRVIIGGVYYRAFQNCNRSDAFAFVFLKEDA
jgi:hypothetical protein